MVLTSGNHGVIDQNALLAGVGQFCKVQQMIGSYPDNHPALQVAIASAETNLRQALGQGGSCDLTIGPRYVMIDGLRHEVAGELADWINALIGLDIISVRFNACLDRESILAACRTLSEAGRGGQHSDQLVEVFRDRVGNAISLGAADFGKLNVHEGAREDGTATGASAWDSLVDALHIDDLPDADSAAHELNQLFETEGLSGLSDWEDRIVSLLKASQSGEHGDGEEVLSWLGDFFLKLHPHLRQQLLTILPTRFDEPELLLERIADRLPVSEVIEGLKAATGKPSPVTIRLLRTLARNQAPNADGGDGGDVPESVDSGISQRLAKLLEEDASEEFCPEDYSRLLEELSHATDRPKFDPDRWPYKDPSEGPQLALHTLEIVGTILGMPTIENLQVQGCLATAARTTQLALQQRRLDLLDPVYRAAKTDHAYLAESRLLIETLGADESITELARAAFGPDGEPVADSPIVNDLAGEIAMSLLEGTHARLGPAQRQFVIDALAKMSPQRAMRRIAEIGPDLLAQAPEILGFLKVLPSNQILSLLESFLSAENDRVRGYAFEVIQAKFVIWPRDLVHSGLVDPYEPIRRLTAEHLATWTVDDRIDLLAPLAVSREHTQHKVVWDLLVQTGELGLSYLCQCLAGRLRDRGTRIDGLRTDLATFLEGHRDHPVVSRALTPRWWSLTATMNRVLNRE